MADETKETAAASAEQATDAQSTNGLEALSFKEGLNELETIVRALEGNQLELEESIKSYERGVALLGLLQKRLETAQQKVTVLMGQLEVEGDEVDTRIS